MSFLYGVADEKHIRLDETNSTTQVKLKPLDTFKFRTNPLLEPRQKTNPYKTSVRYRTSPDTLVELCSVVVNAIPLPKAFQWSNLQVADWIRKLGFPQYQDTFKKNFIDGRTLLRMDTSYLVKINITNLDHIQIIRDAIHQLYGFWRGCFSRSISFPDRPPDALYKFYRVFTGPKYERTRQTDLYRSNHLLRRRPLYETHWQTLVRWLKHLRPIETEIVGGSERKRYNLYYPKAKKPDVVLMRKKSSKFYLNCACMPPCTCDWNSVLKDPWTLKCLQDRSKKLTSKTTSHIGLTCLKVRLPHKYADEDIPSTKDPSTKLVSRVKHRTFQFFE